MTTITVKDITRGEIVAQGDLKSGVIELEGAFYFEPDHVITDNLVITDRTYNCPYKGVCQWIDLKTEEGVVRDVGWVYSRPREGYEYIRDKLGFAFGMRPGIMVEKSR